jgi:hypothetical protein
MQITLNDDEARTLRSALEAYLPDLRRELAGTDLPAREVREELHKRETVIKRLITELATAR